MNTTISKPRTVAHWASLALLACGGPASPIVNPVPPDAPYPPAPLAAAAPPPATPAPSAKPSLELAPPPEASPVQHALGPSGPVRLLQAGASGRWLLLCAGDRDGGPLLVTDAEEPAPVDELLAADPRGRFVVTREAGGVWLLDTVTGERTSLTADVRRTRHDFERHRSFSFDANGERLAYLRSPREVALRTLAEGSERVVATAADVFRLELDPTGSAVVLELLRDDSNGNGRADWPVPEEKTPRPCTPVTYYRRYSGRGDVPVRAVLRWSAPQPKEAPELVLPFPRGDVLREADGALSLDVGGRRTKLAPSACAGRVKFADSSRELLVVGCDLEKKPGRRALWLFGERVAVDLGVEVAETELDREPEVGVRLLPLYPGPDSALLDLESRRLLPLPSGSRVVTTEGAEAIVWRGDSLYRFEATAAREELLASGVAKVPELLVHRGAAYVTPFLVLAGRPGAVRTTERPLALLADGSRLTEVASSRIQASSSLADGPLHWLPPGEPMLLSGPSP